MPHIRRHSCRFAYLVMLVLSLSMLVGVGAARADISFRADYENGSCCGSGSWHDVQYETDRPMSDSFSIVTSPVRQGRYAAKVVVQQGYSPFGWEESTEAATGISGQGEGSDYYYAWSTMFDPSWVNPRGWGQIVQFYTNNWQKYGGPPPISLDAANGHITVSVLAGRFDEPGTSADAWRDWYTHPGTSTPSLIGYSFNHNYQALDTLSLGQWNDFVMHVHWSGRNGQIQLWHRLPGQSWIMRLDINVPTLRYDPQTNISDEVGLIKQGFYRRSFCQQPTVLTACNSTLGLQPPDILYQDAFVRGTNFDEVVAAAFGSGSGSSTPGPSTPPAAGSGTSSPPATGGSSSPPAPSGPDLPLAGLASATDSGCSACTVSTSRGAGDVDATIAGGLDSADTAYGLVDFGGSSGWNGRVWTRDVIALPASTALGGNLAVLQQRDVSGQLVWEIYVDGATRQLSLWSPAGGLGSSAINQSTGVAMDGQNHRVEVSALPNDSVVVRVDDQDKITLTGLSGSTAGNLRFLRVGIDHYDTGTSSEPISVSHSNAGVSTLGWLGTRSVALVPAASGTSSGSTGGTASGGSGSGATGGGGGGGTSASTPSQGNGNGSVTKTPGKTTKSQSAPSTGSAAGTGPSARRPVIFVARPRVAGRHTVFVRLSTRPKNRFQIIVRDARGNGLGSAYAVATRDGRSEQLLVLTKWRGQTKLNVIVRSLAGGRVHRTNMRINLTKRELAACRGSH
jgi:hypothetical protein